MFTSHHGPGLRWWFQSAHLRCFPEHGIMLWDVQAAAARVTAFCTAHNPRTNVAFESNAPTGSLPKDDAVALELFQTDLRPLSKADNGTEIAVTYTTVCHTSSTGVSLLLSVRGAAGALVLSPQGGQFGGSTRRLFGPGSTIDRTTC